MMGFFLCSKPLDPAGGHLSRYSKKYFLKDSGNTVVTTWLAVDTKILGSKFLFFLEHFKS